MLHELTTKKMGFIQCCVMLLLLLVVLCKSGLGLKCRGKATCISLRSCAPFMNLLDALEKPLRPSVVSFLRAHECGFSAGYPMVCCSPIPSNLNIFKHSKPVKQLSAKPNGNAKSVPQKETEVVEVKLKDFSYLLPKDKSVTPSFVVTVATAPPHATAIPYLLRAQRREMREELDRAFAEMSEYDLLRRRRSSKSGLDIEIR